MLLLSRLSGLRRQRAARERSPGRFRGALQKKQSLRLPLRSEGRVAVLDPAFRLERNMRETAAPEDLDAWDPEVLVAPLRRALELAEGKNGGRLRLHSLRFAVILTSVEEEPLSEAHRDLLWRAWGVPVFEQLRDASGHVVARECEVHDGLHLEKPLELPQLTCEFVDGQCECGAGTVRIRNLALAGKRAAAAA